MYSIYVHTTPDGKKYVGSTSQENPKERWRRGSHYKNNDRFREAIKIFGWDNIQHHVIETVEDKETAFKREEYYTILWRTNEPEFGYNILAGKKGKRHTEETRRRMSSSRIGISPGNKGKHLVIIDGKIHYE